MTTEHFYTDNSKTTEIFIVHVVLPQRGFRFGVVVNGDQKLGKTLFASYAEAHAELLKNATRA